MIKWTVFACSLFLFLGGASCATRQKELRAYIDSNPDWTMREHCGYENCEPMVDFLSGFGMTVRIEADPGVFSAEGYIVSTLSFVSVQSPAVLDPTKLVLRVGDRSITGKTLPCSNRNRKRDFLAAEAAMMNPVTVTNRTCLLTYFNYPASSVNENVSLDMSKAIRADGTLLNGPQIHFRRTSEPQD